MIRQGVRQYRTREENGLHSLTSWRRAGKRRILTAALGRAVGIGRADGGVPLVPGVAVRRAGNGVRPPPVGVDGDGSGHVGAAARRALRPLEARVSLGRERACCLAPDGSHEGGEGCDLAKHLERRSATASGSGLDDWGSVGGSCTSDIQDRPGQREGFIHGPPGDGLDLRL